MKTPTGFTLIETLIAITVLTIAIVGPYHAVQTAVNISFVSRDQLIAASLAQEGLEYARSIRDSNFAYNIANPGNTGNWLYGFDGSTRGGTTGKDCFTTNGCTVDVTQASVVTAVVQCGILCTPLNISATGLYTQTTPSGYTVSKYTRKVTFTTINAHEVQAVSTVSWKTLGINYSLTVQDNLQNWL